MDNLHQENGKGVGIIRHGTSYCSKVTFFIYTNSLVPYLDGLFVSSLGRRSTGGLGSYLPLLAAAINTFRVIRQERRTRGCSMGALMGRKCNAKSQRELITITKSCYVVFFRDESIPMVGE